MAEPDIQSLYRYAPQRYNDALRVMGVLRIGTLHDFRREEHARGIADPTEGKKSVRHSIDHLHIADSNDPIQAHTINRRALDAFGTFRLKNVKNITMTGISLQRTFDYPDCFIHCTSTECSRVTLKQFDGANSCMRITNIAAFYRLLTITLNQITPVDFANLQVVRYQKNREEQWNGTDWGTHPAVIKDLSFRPQYEVRAIWVPRFDQSIQPLIIGNYQLGTWCEMVALNQ